MQGKRNKISLIKNTVKIYRIQFEILGKTFLEHVATQRCLFYAPKKQSLFKVFYLWEKVVQKGAKW